jgi:hypothetical protein
MEETPFKTLNYNDHLLSGVTKDGEIYLNHELLPRFE